MGLGAGHGGGAVVQDDQQKIVAVMHGVGQPGSPEWKKVESPMKATTFWPVAREMPGRGIDTGAHADEKIGHGQRRQQPQGVAADIRGEDPFGPRSRRAIFTE